MLRVLCIEDDYDDLCLVKESLTLAAEQYGEPVSIDHAVSLSEMHSIPDSSVYDLFLVDYYLPGGPTQNGMKCVREILSRSSGAPVVLMSGMDILPLDSEAANSIANGELSFIDKRQIDAENLLITLKMVLGNFLRVLVVDDNQDDFELIRLALVRSRAFRCQTEWAPDINSALRSCTERDFDACIIDLVLGENNGLELALKVMREKIIPAVLLVSGQVELSIPADLANTINSGQLQFLPKDKIRPEALARCLARSHEMTRKN